MMNVLVIAPHPDDETIGCGGALCLHAARGDRVTSVFLTSGELGLKLLPRRKAWSIREAEAKQAAGILKIAELFFLRCSDWTLGDEISKAAKLLRPILQKTKPGLIYLPHPDDWHPDHKAALPIVRAALKPGGIPLPALRGYEVWTPLKDYDYVEDTSSVMDRKLTALRTHKSQLQEFDYIRAVTGLGQYRGALAAKSSYAEVFNTLEVKS
jgi:LmbE family N-acetylglucosaminyl deacetylase